MNTKSINYLTDAIFPSEKLL